MTKVMNEEERRAKLLAMYEDVWQALWSVHPSLGLKIMNHYPGYDEASLGSTVLFLVHEGLLVRTQ